MQKSDEGRNTHVVQAKQTNVFSEGEREVRARERERERNFTNRLSIKQKRKCQKKMRDFGATYRNDEDDSVGESL